MENNILFHHVLLFLGFEVYLAGARLFRVGDGKSAGWSGWEHSVNIVTLGQQRYLVDVGYGGNGPRYPLPLVEGPVHENIGTQTMRLAYEPLPGSRQRQWIYYTRNKNVLVQTCMTERARVEALKDQFGIELTEEEQNGIQGRMSALAMSNS